MSDEVTVREAHQPQTAKFFEFRQNNSGGSFEYDEQRGISVNVFVQAFSADEANRIAEGIGLYFDSDMDCPCCGPRWSEQWGNDEGEEEPRVFGYDYGDYTPMKWMDGYETFIHYLDGRIVGKHQ